MQLYKYDIKKFALISVGIAIPTNAAFSSISAAISDSHILNIGFATSIVGLFWFLFDQYLWRLKIFRTLGFSDLPDLNGTWTGDVDRLGEASPHAFEMKIFQTYSKISIQTNTQNSKSNSIAAFFLTDETMKNFDLINYWSSRTKSRNSTTGEYEDFKGVSHIDVRHEYDEIILDDYYFTDRNPSTQGKIILKRVRPPASSEGKGFASWFGENFSFRKRSSIKQNLSNTRNLKQGQVTVVESENDEVKS